MDLFYKPEWPLVCATCGGRRWACVMKDIGAGGGDYCYDCQKLVVIQWMTVEQWNARSTMQRTAEEFIEMWNLDSGPITR